ncbi:hypothetical protein [Succinimonas amylolytica]|uniref:hypothetical protein n=1 Tax=Succinimonas amylolytica TaxID=83769 RepID=UPI00036FB106|nr:hypothetical protein [Succinimonas amylolytica]
MSRLQLALITGTIAFFYLVLAVIYGNNQYMNAEATEILKNGFAVHYLQDAKNFSDNNLLTLVISAPLRVYESVLSPLLVLILLRLGSLGFLLWALYSYVSRTTLAWTVIIYLLSPWFLYNTHFSYTSYMEIGAALYLLTLVKLRNRPESFMSYFIWSSLHILAIGWCLHFHYSGTILCLISMALMIRKILHINILGLILGSCASGFLIYLGVVAARTNTGMYITHDFQEGYPGFGITHVYPILKSVLYWLRFSSALGQNHLVLETSFNWISASEIIAQFFRIVWLAGIYIVGLMTMLWSVLGNWAAVIEAKGYVFTRNEPESNSGYLSVVSTYALLATTVFAGIAPVLLSSDELNVVFAFSLLPVLLIIDKLSEAKLSRHLLIMSLITGILVIISLFGAVESGNFNAEYNYYENASLLVDSFFN